MNDCLSLNYIDLSSFENHDSSKIRVGKLNESNGTMIVKKEFYEKMEPKPLGWKIIFVE